MSKHVIIVGAGPAGLMAAETIARAGVKVTIFERMASPARKFLLAGRGGLNLTHSEPLATFTTQYGPASERLAPILAAFSPDDVRRWSEELGEPTFVGTSGRVFPKGFKASPLLRAWLRKLAGLGVQLRARHKFSGWNADGEACFETPDGNVSVTFDAMLLALGGASWPKLGSDGAWLSIFADGNVAVSPLRPANCGFDVAWSDHMRQRFAGAPLKPIALSFAGKRLRGEAIVTANGIEGGGIYALSAQLRDAIAEQGEAVLRLDLRPDVSFEELARRLTQPRGKQSTSTFMRKAGGLSPVANALLREARALPQTAGELAGLIKDLPLRLTGTRPIERAISSAGGVRFDELDAHLMLKRMPGIFLAGEMIDWEAPTGGYLLQACFATGVVAGRGMVDWLEQSRD